MTYFTYRRSAATTTAVTVVPHLNRATVRAAEYGTTTPTSDLGDDE